MSDRVRPFTTVYPSTARTATPTAALQRTGLADNLVIVIDVTAASATPSVVCTIDFYDPISDNYLTLLTSSAITGISTTKLEIGPNIPAVANLAATSMLSNLVRITMTHADADSITYSVSALAR
jgi:hypothetical protein